MLTDSLVINDYTAARPDTSMSLSLYESGLNRSQSLSPVLGRSITSMRGRSRSPSPSRRSPSPSRRSPSPRRYRVDDYDDEVEHVGKCLFSQIRTGFISLVFEKRTQIIII